MPPLSPLPLVGLLLALALASAAPFGFGFLQPVGAAPSTVFVGSSGVLIPSSLSVEGIDVVAALTSLQSQVGELSSTVESQAVRIASLESDLTATNAVVAAQAQTIAALTEEVGAINSTVTDISDLTGETTIVIVVNGLRRLTSQLSTDLLVLDGAVANQTAAIETITSSINEITSLSGDSTLVTTVTELSSTTASLTSTVTAIGDLTGSSTIVTTIESLIDSMTDLTIDVSTVQALETSSSQMITTLSTTVTAQVTLINNAITSLETALEKEIAQVNSTLLAAIVALQVRATADEASITSLKTLTATHTTQIAALQTLTATYSSEITSLQTSVASDEAAILALQTIDSRHIIGDSSTGLDTTFYTGWTLADGDTTSTGRLAKFWVDRDIVHFEGQISYSGSSSPQVYDSSGDLTGTSVSAASIFVLPTGYRPSSTETDGNGRILTTTGADSYAEIGITSTGIVFLRRGSATNRLSLDGLSFRIGD